MTRSTLPIFGFKSWDKTAQQITPEIYFNRSGVAAVQYEDSNVIMLHFDIKHPSVNTSEVLGRNMSFVSATLAYYNDDRDILESIYLTADVNIWYIKENHFKIMTDSLNTPERREETLRWIQGFHATSDSLDSTAFVQTYFTEDAVIQFANSPVVKAHGPFIDIQSQRLKVLESMKHEIVSFDILPDKIYHTARITYKLKNDPSGEAIVIPALAIFYKSPEDFKINKFEVYADVSPVFKRAQEIAAGAPQV